MTDLPAQRRSSGFAVVLTAALLGLAVGAALVTGGFLLFGGGKATGSGPISTPDRLGDFVRFADAPRNQSEQGKRVVERIQRWKARDAERLSAAHDGAAASTERYTDADLENQFTLIAVRASTPFPPYVPFEDAAELGLQRPFRELLEFGEVACEVTNDPVPQNQDDRPGGTHVVACVRTGSVLTVQVIGVTGELRDNPDRVVALVNEAWTALT